MIYVACVEPDDIGWRDYQRDTKAATSELVALAKQRRLNSEDIDERLYKERREDIFNRFGNRCAYCEARSRGVSQFGDVDHYRPKLGVMGLDGKPVFVRTGRRKCVHPGYYWLAFDWCNLLPACSLCNRPGRKEKGKCIGKGEVFPVEGGRNALDAASLAREKPLLLNPNMDEPSDHLELDVETGVFIPKVREDGRPSERGQVTIDLLDLNRDGLILERKWAFHEFYETLERLYNNLHKSIDRLTVDRRDLERFENFQASLPFMFAVRLAHEIWCADKKKAQARDREALKFLKG